MQNAPQEQNFYHTTVHALTQTTHTMSRLFIYINSTWWPMRDEIQATGIVPPLLSNYCIYKTKYQIETFNPIRAAKDFDFIWDLACYYMDSPYEEPCEISLKGTGQSGRENDERISGVEFEFAPQLSLKERNEYAALWLAGSRLPGYIFGKNGPPPSQVLDNSPKKIPGQVDAQTQTDLEPGFPPWQIDPTWIINKRIPSEKRNWIMPSCLFCRKNKEAKSFSYSHIFRDKVSYEIQCPVLRLCVCSICSATGKWAHTAEYCPLNPNRKIHVHQTPKRC